MHCIVIENHQTGEIIAFYDGDTYELDGRKYSEKGRSVDVDYVLENYKPVKYVHKQLNEFKSYIESNKINKVVASADPFERKYASFTLCASPPLKVLDGCPSPR